MPRSILLILTLGLVVGCTPDDTYPISHEECSEDDPVLTLDAADCGIPPATGVGTF